MVYFSLTQRPPWTSCPHSRSSELLASCHPVCYINTWIPGNCGSKESYTRCHTSLPLPAIGQGLSRGLSRGLHLTARRMGNTEKHMEIWGEVNVSTTTVHEPFCLLPQLCMILCSSATQLLIAQNFWGLPCGNTGMMRPNLDHLGSRSPGVLIWITSEADPKPSTRAHAANLGGAGNTSRMEGGDPGDKCF